MKKLLLITLLILSYSSQAQFKFDIGFSVMQSFKKNIDIGTIYQRINSKDTSYTTRIYQAGAFSLYTKTSYCFQNISKSLKGLISIPINAGISSITTGSVNNGPNKTTINFEYDAAVLYGVAGGAYLPEDLGATDFGYFFNIGAGFVGLTQEPDYEVQDDPKRGTNLAFQKDGENKSFMNKISFGPVIHAGFKIKFHPRRLVTYDEGIAITFRPGFGRSLTYMQISIFSILK